MPRSQAHTSSPCTSRTTRHRMLRIAAAGLTAVAALTLTACGGQDNPLKTSAAKPFNPAPRTAEGPDAKAGEEQTAKGSGAHGGTRPDGGVAEQASTGHGGTGTGAGSATGKGGRTTGIRHTACDAAKIRIVAQPLKEPVNHLLLVATNTSGATCDLYSVPNLRFDQAQSPSPNCRTASLRPWSPSHPVSPATQAC